MPKSTLIHGVPSDILLFFFRKAKVQLEKYSYHPLSNSSSTTSSSTGISTNDGNEYKDGKYNYTPIPIKVHQQHILEEQMTVLNDIIKDYNSVKKTEITVETVQNSLRLFGSSSTTDDDGSGASGAALKNAMTEMNEAARKAFCKSILCSEYYWYKQQKQKEKQQGVQQKEQDLNGRNKYVLDLMMLDYNKAERPLNNGQDRGNDRSHDQETDHLNRQLTLEFCGLCTTAFKLPEVQQYIQSGKELIFSEGYDNENNEDNDQDAHADAAIFTSTSTPQKRISHLQQMIICSLGYEPYYASQEIIQKQIEVAANAVDGSDTELKEASTTFVLNLQEVSRDALNHSLKQQSNSLSDEKEGGVTRVVGVTYSEREVSNYPTSTTTGNGGVSSSEAPMNQKMVEKNEEIQRQQLEMAQKATKLQQMILSQLWDMEEEERSKCLMDAKKAHEDFLKDAMALPPAERVTFIQNVDQDLQRKLLMYKLWNATESK